MNDDVKGIGPTVRPEAEAHWDGARRGVLVVEHCPTCDRYIFPPAAWCVRCRSADVEHVEFHGRGRVVTYTINRVSWIEGMRVPFALGYVEFDDMPEVRLPCRLRVPFDQLRVGLVVDVGFEPGPDGFAIPSFVAAGGEGAPA